MAKNDSSTTPVAGGAHIARNQTADLYGWIPVGASATPDSVRDVLVWNTVEQQPMAAFFDDEENCWFSKYDGHQLEDGSVTHWREIQMPEGVMA